MQTYCSWISSLASEGILAWDALMLLSNWKLLAASKLATYPYLYKYILTRWPVVDICFYLFFFVLPRFFDWILNICAILCIYASGSSAVSFRSTSRTQVLVLQSHLSWFSLLSHKSCKLLPYFIGSGSRHAYVIGIYSAEKKLYRIT